MRRAALAALTLAAAAGIPPAAAQPVAPQAVAAQTDPDRSLIGRVSQSFALDSNYDLDDPSPGTSYFGDTRLALGYLAETATQSFALGFDTGVRALWRAEEPFEAIVASPSLGYLIYAHEGLDTAFDADFRVRTRQVDSTSQVDLTDPGDPGQPDPDNLDQGSIDTREQRYDAEIGLTLGRTSPSTIEFTLDANAYDYSDEIGTSLVPRRSVEGGALWTLRVTPVLSTAVFGSYYYYTADDPRDSELNVAEAELGLVYQPSDTLRVRGGLGYADRHREGTIDGVRQTIQDNAGLTARADISYEGPAFRLFGNARLTAAAPDTRLSGGLTAFYLLPRGQIVGRAYQTYVGGRGGDEERITGGSIGLTREINTVSRIGLDFAYATQENQDDPDEPNIDRTDVTLSYGYDLTANIDAEVGYVFRNRIEDPQDANSNRVYFVIGRDFVTGL